VEERRRSYKEKVRMGAINFGPGVREALVNIGLLAPWDDGSAQTREAHDESVRIQNGRPNFQERCRALREELEEKKRKSGGTRPLGPGEIVHNPYIYHKSRKVKKGE